MSVSKLSSGDGQPYEGWPRYADRRYCDIDAGRKWVWLSRCLSGEDLMRGAIIQFVLDSSCGCSGGPRGPLEASPNAPPPTTGTPLGPGTMQQPTNDVAG